MKLTKTQLREMIKQELNEISDDKNPEYMFNTMDTSLVVGIANKKIDAVKYAKKQLAGRGFDKRGKWVGFEKAKKIHRV
jgi:predicted house-cleaning noncanonical NTP pyrophosphatase (MazG superfamily)|tara:strand:- start:884 stop:1120 length:237 start_codon:yes stop_codon:yes gene_type:complete